jgi:Na+/phosphate symporter
METSSPKVVEEILPISITEKISRWFSSAIIIVVFTYIVYYFILFLKGSDWKGNSLTASILFNSLLVIVGLSLIYFLALVVLWITRKISPGAASKFFLGTITALLFVALLLFLVLKWNGL